MKRRSHDHADRVMVDSSVGALIEKWISADIPPIDWSVTYATCV